LKGDITINLYLLKTEDDAEQLWGLFEKKEHAELAKKFGPKKCPFAIIDFCADNSSEDGYYYFLVDEDEYELVSECFLTREEAIDYADENCIDTWELQQIKINSLNPSNDTIDDDGNIEKPDDDDLEYSIYNAVEALKENGVSFELVEIDCEDND